MRLGCLSLTSSVSACAPNASVEPMRCLWIRCASRSTTITFTSTNDGGDMTQSPHTHSASCGCPAHTIHHAQSHLGWDNAFAPVLRIEPGESIEFDVYEASGGQLSPASKVQDVGTLDFGRINPVTGPVFIEGAEP